jgi:hypothetical protein
VELAAVEQLAEHFPDLLDDDAGPVVLDRDAEAVLARLDDLDGDLGQDAGLLAGVERVVDRLLDRRQQRLERGVEPEQVAVLGEELADGDLALARRHLLGGRAARLALLLGLGLGLGLEVELLALRRSRVLGLLLHDSVRLDRRTRRSVGVEQSRVGLLLHVILSWRRAPADADLEEIERACKPSRVIPCAAGGAPVRSRLGS